MGRNTAYVWNRAETYTSGDRSSAELSWERRLQKKISPWIVANRDASGGPVITDPI